MDEFPVSVELRLGCQVVGVSGDLDADTAPHLEFELDRLLGGLPVLIDLNQVRFLTSAGILALLSERTFDRPALFCLMAATLRRCWRSCVPIGWVPIYADLQAALSSLTA